MSNKMIKIIPYLAILTAAISCSSMAEKFDNWGKSMPTYGDTWCEGWFCWNDTTTKEEAFKDKTPALDMNSYSPEQNPGANMGDPSLSGYGMMPEDMNQPSLAMGDSPTQGEIAVPDDERPWKTKKKTQALPLSQHTGDPALQGQGELPPGYDPTRPPPPGAIPGVNWPPIPPEGGYQNEDNSDPSFLPGLDIEGKGE